MAGHSRRSLLQLAGAAALLRGRIASAQQPAPPQKRSQATGSGGRGGLEEPFPALERRSTVAVVHGDERRKNVHDSLVAIDKQILPGLKSKKYVVIKPNNVNTVNQLAATHADALRGILDYLAPRFKGPIKIAEASAGETHQGFENFKYPALVQEYARQKVSLVDLNQDGHFEIVSLLDGDMHPIPARIAKMLVDPDAFVISSAMLKTHNTVVATLSVKNMVLGAPLHQAPKETPRWNEKRKYHFGIRQTHYNMLLTAQRLQPHWGAGADRWLRRHGRQRSCFRNPGQLPYRHRLDRFHRGGPRGRRGHERQSGLARLSEVLRRAWPGAVRPL